VVRSSASSPNEDLLSQFIQVAAVLMGAGDYATVKSALAEVSSLDDVGLSALLESMHTAVEALHIGDRSQPAASAASSPAGVTNTKGFRLASGVKIHPRTGKLIWRRFDA
jgi:hypothetical protein